MALLVERPVQQAVLPERQQVQQVALSEQLAMPRAAFQLVLLRAQVQVEASSGAGLAVQVSVQGAHQLLLLLPRQVRSE